MENKETLPKRAIEVREELFQILLEKDPKACRSSFEEGFQYAYEIQQQIINERDEALDIAMDNVKIVTDYLKKANETKKISKLTEPAFKVFTNPDFRGN